MRMQQKFLALMIFSLVFLVSFILGGENNTAKAIPVGPDKYFFSLNSGETKKEQLQIYGRENLENTQKIYLYTVGMRKVGEENDREFYIPNRNDQAEVANWIKLNQTEADLRKGDVITIDWEIAPENISKCGTNLAAIVVSSAPENNIINGNIVNFKSEVVSQVHIDIKSIDGNPCKGLEAKTNLLDFKVNSTQNSFEYRNIPFLTRIENDGNLIARSPRGFIEIYQGDRKLETINFNPEGLDIYPNTIRRFDNIWIDKDYPVNGNFFEQIVYEAQHFYFGEYKAKLGVSRNANPQIISTVSFWIIPWKLIITILVVFLILIILVFIIKKIRKSKKKKQEEAEMPQIIRLRDF